MSNLVVIEFENEETAFEMRAYLAKLQKEYLITFYPHPRGYGRQSTRKAKRKRL